MSWVRAFVMLQIAYEAVAVVAIRWQMDYCAGRLWSRRVEARVAIFGRNFRQVFG
jgi:hypothetical protein